VAIRCLISGVSYVRELMTTDSHINKDMICHFVLQVLGNRKILCVCVFSQRSTDEQKMHRFAIHENFIQACQSHPHSLICIVTGVECWVLQYDHEAKYKGCL